jgi:hypothetical protein
VNEKILDSVRKLLELLINRFGAGGTVALVAVLLFLALLYKVYSNWRADRAIDRALEEKERTIQRLANQERTWRRVFLTDRMKLSSKEADRLLSIEGDFADPEESRGTIERSRKRPS